MSPCTAEAWGVGPRPEEDPVAGGGKKNKKGAGAGGGVLDSRHDDAKMLMEVGRRDVGAPEREERLDCFDCMD